MNILGIRKRLDSGCEYHRVILPMGFMDGIKGYVTNMLTKEKMEGWDIILFNRVHPYDADNIQFKDIMNAKVVMDIDDYWKLPANHINHFQYEKIAVQIERNIREADMVTVTNEILADKVRPLNSNVHAFPNAIPFGRNQFTDDRRPSERVRIFWAGTVTHEHDIKILSNPIKRLAVHADKIQMVIGGYFSAEEAKEQYDKKEICANQYYAACHTQQIWDRMFMSYTAGGTLPYAKLHATGPTDYMQMYENADIMVIPLEDSEWHACKSNLKILEAATKRIPCIVSNVAPYNLDKDAPVFWVNSQKDWFSHLNYLILNPQSREDYGNKLYEWAKSKYDLIEINKQRAAAFRNLVGNTATHPNLCETPALP